PLKSRRTGNKKSSYVSGEVQLQFTLYDTSTPGGTSHHVMEKFWSIAGIEPELLTPTKSGHSTNGAAVPQDEDEDDELDDEEEPSDETEDLSKPETVEKR